LFPSWSWSSFWAFPFRHFVRSCRINGHFFPVHAMKAVVLGGLVVGVLATGPKVRGFDPDRGRWIFKGDKNPEHHFLRRGSKAVDPVDLRHVKEP
jgi:hypothetical protein